MKKIIFFLFLSIFGFEKFKCNCVFKIKLTKTSKHKANEIVVLNFQEKAPDFINDSIAIYSFNPSGPINAMIVLNKSEHWHTFAWMNPDKDTVELSVDFNNKNSQLKKPKPWDLVFNNYIQLFNTGEIAKADQFAANFIEKNRDSYLSLWLLNHGAAFNNKSLKLKLFDLLNNNLKTYKDYADIEKDLNQRQVPQIDQAFKEFVMTDIHQQAFNSTAIGDKIIILHFWTNSCKGCKKSIDDLSEFECNIDTSQVMLISICFDENIETWLKAGTSHKIKWTNLWQPNGVYCDLCLHYDLTVMPLFVVFNKEKKLQSVIEGDAINLLKREVLKF